MQAAAELLIGKRDYTSFSKSNTQTKTNICDIRKAYWEDKGDQWIFNISADRFLRNMVRAIVGSLLEVGKGKMSLFDFQKMIEARDRKLAGQSVPAQGLYLNRVVYPQDIFI
jgi:tRNA pseudouridine38-40 synthase